MKRQLTGFRSQHQTIRTMGFRTIGKVSSRFKKPELRDWDNVVSEIRMNPRWIRALKGLEDFSHIIVLYYLSQSKRISIQVHPKGRKDLPLVGMFATRSPHRPNPIAMTICRLLKRRGSRLMVRGLDAIDGTPVIDIKPYIPDNDLIKRARVPSWIKKLR